MVVQRGFPAPPSYHIDRLRQAPTQHFYDVMTNGYGAMYSFAGRVSPQDAGRSRLTSGHCSFRSIRRQLLCRPHDERGASGLAPADLARLAWIVGGVGVAASLIGAVIQPEAFAFAWLGGIRRQCGCAGRWGVWRCCLSTR